MVAEPSFRHRSFRIEGVEYPGHMVGEIIAEIMERFEAFADRLPPVARNSIHDLYREIVEEGRFDEIHVLAARVNNLKDKLRRVDEVAAKVIARREEHERMVARRAAYQAKALF